MLSAENLHLKLGLNRGESNCQLCHPGVALWGALMVARLCSPAVQHPTQWWLAENCPEEELCVKPPRALHPSRTQKFLPWRSLRQVTDRSSLGGRSSHAGSDQRAVVTYKARSLRKHFVANNAHIGLLAADMCRSLVLCKDFLTREGLLTSSAAVRFPSVQFLVSIQ